MTGIYATEQAALRFLQSDIPRVVLEVPGCADCFVNQAHERVFGNSDFRTAKSLEELMAFQPGERQKNFKSLCYCDKRKISAAFALRSEHCAFESSYLKLREGKQRSVSTLAFLECSEEHGRRTYNVFRVHSKILDKASEGGRLECQIIPLGRRVDVSTPKGSIVKSGTQLEIIVREDAHEVLWQDRYLIPDANDYEVFQSLLASAISQLEQGVSINDVLDELLSSARKEIFAEAAGAYGPVEGHIRDRFLEPDRLILIKNLQRDCGSLFDSLVLTAEVGTRLEAGIRDLLPVQTSQLLIQLEQIAERAGLPVTPESSADSVTETITPRGTLSRSAAGVAVGTGTAFSDTRGGQVKDIATPAEAEEFRPRCLVQYDQQKMEFEKIRVHMTSDYAGKFVAFCEGRVIDADEDEITLVKRIGQTHKAKFVLFSKMADPSAEPVCIDTLGM